MVERDWPVINRSVSKPPSCDATNVMFAAEDVYLCKVYEDIVILDLKSDVISALWTPAPGYSRSPTGASS